MSRASKFRRVGVIMAGGVGERFWPLSRQDHPKQLLRLASENETMLAEAVKRLIPLIPAEQIFVATGEDLLDVIRAGETGVPEENVIAEPCRRDTAGCLVYATAHALAIYGGDGSDLSMAVVTADHLIGNVERFRESVRISLETAEELKVLTTHGIVPNRPETGFGYIQAEEGAAPLAESDGIRIFPVVAFHEKPNRQKAEDFISMGHYYWNSGMFFWRVDTFLEELERVRPEMAQATRDMVSAIAANDKGTVRSIFEGLESISIDYALMEHARNVAVARADYEWEDLGTWSSLERTRTPDDEGNVSQGEPVLVDCHDCVVYNDVGADKMAVSVIGADNLIVVVSEDGVLVVPKDRAQDVRHAVRELKARGAKQI